MNRTGGKVCSDDDDDDDVDHMIETEENAKTKNKRLVQDIVILVFNRSL